MKLEVLKGNALWQQAAAYSVRIQGMGRQHHIPLENEIDEYDGSDTNYVVLLDQGYPVATCRFYELSTDSVMVGRLVVLPEYRGQGLGRVTIEEAETWIRDLGYTRVLIESRVEKVAFYEKMGYTADCSKFIHGVTFDCIPMDKEL